MLFLQNISAGYAGRLVLQDIAVNIAAGEFVGLIGPNGSGKTTLLRVVSGVLPAWQGEVWLGGRKLREMGRRDVARRVAHLLQDCALGLAFSVRELVLMGRSPHLPRFGRETERDLAIVERAMDAASVSHLADRPITAISGGERQRALIAMCLAQEPQVLLLDEPTSHLDIGHQLSILNLIRNLNRQTPMTVVAVLHDLNLAAEFCDRLVLLDRGRVVAAGAPVDVLTAEMILNVYGVRVVIGRNPVSDAPHTVLAASGCPEPLFWADRIIGQRGGRQ
ncbi:MAG: ABC transporter ATP-binding protein [Thermoguttaceae bacterium]|jgi:iron complex transport system ATP-binding protein